MKKDVVLGSGRSEQFEFGLLDRETGFNPSSVIQGESIPCNRSGYGSTKVSCVASSRLFQHHRGRVPDPTSDDLLSGTITDQR